MRELHDGVVGPTLGVDASGLPRIMMSDVVLEANEGRTSGHGVANSHTRGVNLLTYKRIEGSKDTSFGVDDRF